jgi:flagellar assembly protein FliH
MIAVRKFLFEDSFDAAPTTIRPAAPPVDEREWRAREDRARADGFEAGRSHALDDAAVRNADAVQAMAARLSSALAEAGALAAMLTEDAAELAIAAAGYLAGPVAAPVFAEHARAQLRTIIGEQLGTPRIAARVAPALQPHLQAAADHVVAEHDYAGRVEIVGDASLAVGDLVIEWQTGALRELRRDRLAALAARIDDYFREGDE